MTDGWRDRAACTGMDINMFYQPRGLAPNPHAVVACAGCPVVEECLDDELAYPLYYNVGSHGLFGYRAGLTAHQRRCRRADRGIPIVSQGHFDPAPPPGARFRGMQ